MFYIFMHIQEKYLTTLDFLKTKYYKLYTMISYFI